MLGVGFLPFHCVRAAAASPLAPPATFSAGWVAFEPYALMLFCSVELPFIVMIEMDDHRIWRASARSPRTSFLTLALALAPEVQNVSQLLVIVAWHSVRVCICIRLHAYSNAARGGWSRQRFIFFVVCIAYES